MRSWALLFVLLVASNVRAQQHVLVVLGDEELPKAYWEPIRLASSAMVDAEKRAIIHELQSAGRLEASFDTCRTDSSKTECALHLGPVYRWAQLSAAGVDAEIASGANFKERYFNGGPIDPEQLARLYDRMLAECENNGFPFANLHLDSIRSDGDGLRATLVLDRGRPVRIDSVVVRGTAKVAQRYLWSHIGIAPGSWYDESLVAAASTRIRELPFVSQKREPYVVFTPEKTKLYLFLDDKRASSINGILGILPDPVTGKVSLTGDIDLRLKNALHHGEGIELNWRSLQDKTQDLKLRFDYPYLMNTPFGIDLNLKLFKRDTSFLEVRSRAALQYLFGRNDKFTVFIDNKSSQRLGKQTISQPGLADVRILSYGIGIERQRFDYRFNPRSGNSVRVDASAGRKRSSTAVLNEATPTPEIKSLQYEVEGVIVQHVPIARRSTIRFVAQGGTMINDDLYSNELYRLGGLKTLRGVNEASILCSSYAIGTIEFRYLFEQNGNFLLFFDQAWWENQSSVPLDTDTPIGFGAGASFETKAGIFALTYALGQQGSSPVDLRSGKIHFGFTSLF